MNQQSIQTHEQQLTFSVYRVFANAESLFYYTAFSRPTKTVLSLEEVRRLLAQAAEQPEVERHSHLVENVTSTTDEGENRSSDLTVTEVDNEEVDGNEPHLSQDQQGEEEETDLDQDEGRRKAEADAEQDQDTVEIQTADSLAEEQAMLLQDMTATDDIPASNDVQHDNYVQNDEEQDFSQYEGEYYLDDYQVEVRT